MQKLIKLVPVFAAFILGFIVSTGTNYALAHVSQSGNTGFIHSCIGSGFFNNGRLRIVGAHTNCKSNETALDWQQLPEAGTVHPFICIDCDFTSSNFGNRFLGRNLSNAYIVNSRFNSANINLSNTIFIGANLTKSNFEGAVTRGINLSNAVLENSNFSSADFSSATLLGAKTSGANFDDVTWSNTVCPDGTNSEDNGKTCEGHMN